MGECSWYCYLYKMGVGSPLAKLFSACHLLTHQVACGSDKFEKAS